MTSIYDVSGIRAAERGRFALRPGTFVGTAVGSLNAPACYHIERALVQIDGRIALTTRAPY